MTVGILTFHIAHNYGAFMQTYSLQTFLEKIGCKVEIIDYRPEYLLTPYYPSPKIPKYVSEKHLWKYFGSICFTLYDKLFKYSMKKERYNNFSKTISNNLHLSSNTVYTYDELKKQSFEYDIYIAGSDQIWNPSITGNKLDPAYFFMNISNDKMKVAYGASMGRQLPNNYIDTFQKYSKHLNAISLRECSAVQFVEENSNLKPVCVVDPTLLLTAEEWSKIALAPKIIPNKYILVYNIAGKESFIAKVKSLAHSNNLNIVWVGTRSIYFKYLSFQSYVKPEEFVWYFANAEFVITDSFHGTMFSIINRKPFYSIAPYPQNIRITDHLKRLGLLNRLFEKPDDVKDLLYDIDYDAVNEKLDVLRGKSMDYLKDVIELAKK